MDCVTTTDHAFPHHLTGARRVSQQWYRFSRPYRRVRSVTTPTPQR